MHTAIVKTFNPKTGRGSLQARGGSSLAFAYEQGQSMMISIGSTEPKFTGRHNQPVGYRLKHPAVGDVVVFEGTDDQPLVRWGYLEHYDALALRVAAGGDNHFTAA